MPDVCGREIGPEVRARAIWRGNKVEFWRLRFVARIWER
jgi:hypothetical protein